MKRADVLRTTIVAAVAVFADVLQGGSIVAANTSLDANDPTKGNVAGLGSSEFGLGKTPNPTSPSTYGSDVNIIRMMNNPFIVGDSFYNGTLKIENDTTVSFQHGGKNPAGDGRTEGLTVMGDLLRADNNVTVLFESLVPSAEYSMPRQYKDLNYIYVDGKISMGDSQFKMGTDHVNPINLYAGSIYMGTDSDSFVNWSGDIYLHDPNGVSKFVVGKSGMSLVQFISNNIERPNVLGNYMGSSVFCNNKELTIIGCGSDSNVSIGGDIIMSNPQGHLIIDLSGNYQSLVVGGSVVCAGRLTIKISDMHNFKAIGGIYVDSSKVTFDVNNGKINDVAYNGSGAAFVRANFTGGFTMQHTTSYGNAVQTLSYKNFETSEVGTYCNTTTYAYIQSLGVEATGTTNYDDTFKRIRTNARVKGYPKNEVEDGTWVSQYLADLASKIGNGYENYDYSLYPYCGRWDEIFEKYVRWDCHQTSDGFAYDNAMKESEAAGHTYVNYKPVAGGETFKACTPILSNAALVPARVYGARNLQAGVNYFNSKSHFSPYPAQYDFPSIAYKEVTIGTHKGDGSYDMPKKSFFVVEDSCVINLADINTNSDENKKRFNIFINPEGKSSPINIVFRGRVAGDEMVNVVINNTVKYDVSGGSFDYTNASYDKTYTKLKADPGREQVRIFFEKNSSGTTGGDKFNIYCTGAYGQFNEGTIHAIGSPYYPGYGDYIAQYGDIDSVTPTSIDAYAHELIPNVRVYAESGSALECASQFFVNAEILMPEGSILTGTNKIQHKVYFKEYPSSEEVYVENKYLFVLGSSCVKALRANDAQGIVVCLEDQFRDKFTVPPPPVVSNVVARQRWPWNGLVDVDYEIGGYTAGLKVEIEFDEQGDPNRHWVATNFLAGAEPTLNRGHNRATWDTKADGVTNIVADVVATVKLVNSLSVTSAASAPIDLSNGIDHLTVQELAAAMIQVEDGIASAQAAINDSVEERTDVEAQLQAVENTYNNAGYNNTDLAQLEQDVKDLMVQEADARRAVADNKKNLTESNYYQNYARPLAKAIIKYYLVYTGEVSVADLDKVDIGEWFNQGYYDKHFCVRYLNNEGMPQERFFDFVTCDAAGNPLIKESLSDKFDDTPSNVTGIVVLEKTPTYAFHEAGDNTKPVVVEDTTENRATYKAQTKAATMKYRDVGGNHYIISQRTGWGTATAEDSVKGALKIDLNAGKEAVELSKIIQALTVEIQEINSKIDLANARINELTALRPAIEGRLAYLMSIATDEESSEAFRLDTREGRRQSDGTETLAFSASWSGNSNSVVTIAQACDTPCTTNGALVSGLNGEGEWSWTAQYDGTYTLTHVTITDGVTGKVETATFVVSGLGPPMADLTAEIAWKLLEATGTYFAQLKVTCTNGLSAGVSDLKFMFADRIGADGKNEAALWSTLSRSANANTTTVDGEEYRFVALDPTLITEENTPVAYGVSDMSASSIPVNERTIELYVRRRVNPQAGNESAANVDNFVGYVAWRSGEIELTLPVAAGAVGRALGAAGLSTASSNAALPSPKQLNTALAVGVMLEEDGEPYCRFSEFSVDGDTIRGKIEVGADGQAGSVGQNARLVLLGGDSPGGALTELCTVDVEPDGSFSVPAPKDARFFKLALEIGEVAE